MEKVIYRHPKGRFDVIETTGVGMLGIEYRVREAVLTPERDQRGMLHDSDRLPRPIHELHTAAEVEIKKTTPMTDEEKKRIRALFRKGYSVPKIEQATGRSETAIRKYLIRAGLMQKAEVRLYTQEELKLMRKLWAQGWSAREIGERIGRTKEAVYSTLKRI